MSNNPLLSQPPTLPTQNLSLQSLSVTRGYSNRALRRALNNQETSLNFSASIEKFDLPQLTFTRLRTLITLFFLLYWSATFLSVYTFYSDPAWNWSGYRDFQERIVYFKTSLRIDLFLFLFYLPSVIHIAFDLTILTYFLKPIISQTYYHKSIPSTILTLINSFLVQYKILLDLYILVLFKNTSDLLFFASLLICFFKILLITFYTQLRSIISLYRKFDIFSFDIPTRLFDYRTNLTETSLTTHWGSMNDFNACKITQTAILFNFKQSSEILNEKFLYLSHQDITVFNSYTRNWLVLFGGDMLLLPFRIFYLADFGCNAMVLISILLIVV
jgi:hypothetical protein